MEEILESKGFKANTTS